MKVVNKNAVKKDTSSHFYDFYDYWHTVNFKDSNSLSCQLGSSETIFLIENYRKCMQSMKILLIMTKANEVVGLYF